MTHATDDPKRRQQTRQTRPQQAKPRRLQKDREHLQREQARAPRHLQALEQALEELGLPDTIVEEVQWQRRTQATRLGKSFGLMFPTFCGCRTPSELTRVRGWDKHLPGKVLGALPKRQGVTHWQRWGQDWRETWWQHVEDKRPAPRRRWQWTWVRDDRVCKTYGPRLGLGGTWWRGQEPRVRQGSDGWRRVLGIGTGNLGMPVDFTSRRPDPGGPGRPCHDQRTWLPVMGERTGVALPRRRLSRPAPLIVAESWVGDSQWMAPVALPQHGMWLVEGTSRDVFHRPDGRRVTGPELRTGSHGPWRDCLWLPGIR